MATTDDTVIAIADSYAEALLELSESQGNSDKLLAELLFPALQSQSGEASLGPQRVGNLFRKNVPKVQERPSQGVACLFLEIEGAVELLHCDGALIQQDTPEALSGLLGFTQGLFDLLQHLLRQLNHGRGRYCPCLFLGRQQDISDPTGCSPGLDASEVDEYFRAACLRYTGQILGIVFAIVCPQGIEHFLLDKGVPSGVSIVVEFLQDVAR